MNSSEVRRYAFARLPRAGLANKLFVWARALTWSSANGAEMLPTSWAQLRVGPWLRQEQDLKMYLDLFCQTDFRDRLKSAYLRLTLPKLREVDHLAFAREGAGVYEFAGLRRFFHGLEPARALILKSLVAAARPHVRAAYAAAKAPDIAVHVRHGDFLRNGLAVPSQWYALAIATAREAVPGAAVTVFSDGTNESLSTLLALPGVRLHRPANALSDLLLMSRSRFLIATGASSFSAWASFLGTVPSLSQREFPLSKWEMREACQLSMGTGPKPELVEQIRNAYGHGQGDAG